MSEEQLKAFLKKVKAETSLQEKLKAAADPNAVSAIAKEAGFSISADDIKRAQSELSDEDLDEIAGGHQSQQKPFPYWWVNLNKSRLNISQHFKQ